MFEASNFEKVNQVLPFPGSVVDVLCGNEDNAVVTTVFTLNVHFIGSFLKA